MSPSSPSPLNVVTPRRAASLFLSLALLASSSLNFPAAAAAGRQGKRIFSPARGSATKGVPDFVPGEVLVRFRSEPKAEAALLVADTLRDEGGREMPVEFARDEGLSAVSGLRLGSLPEGFDSPGRVVGRQVKPEVRNSPRYSLKSFKGEPEPRPKVFGLVRVPNCADSE